MVRQGTKVVQGGCQSNGCAWPLQSSDRCLIGRHARSGGSARKPSLVGLATSRLNIARFWDHYAGEPIGRGTHKSALPASDMTEIKGVKSRKSETAPDRLDCSTTSVQGPEIRNARPARPRRTESPRLQAETLGRSLRMVFSEPRNHEPVPRTLASFTPSVEAVLSSGRPRNYPDQAPQGKIAVEPRRTDR